MQTQQVFDRALDEIKSNKKKVCAVGFFIRLKDETIYEVNYEKGGRVVDAVIGSQILAEGVSRRGVFYDSGD